MDGQLLTLLSLEQDFFRIRISIFKPKTLDWIRILKSHDPSSLSHTQHSIPVIKVDCLHLRARNYVKTPRVYSET